MLRGKKKKNLNIYSIICVKNNIILFIFFVCGVMKVSWPIFRSCIKHCLKQSMLVKLSGNACSLIIIPAVQLEAQKFSNHHQINHD